MRLAYKNACGLMFIVSLVTIAKIQTQPVNRQTDKGKGVFIYNGVLLLSQKEWNLVICKTKKKMSVARGHVAQNKPDTEKQVSRVFCHG